MLIEMQIADVLKFCFRGNVRAENLEAHICSNAVVLYCAG